MDFAAIDEHAQPLVRLLDHQILNEVDGLANPTSELLAVWWWQRLAADAARARRGGRCRDRIVPLHLSRVIYSLGMRSRRSSCWTWRRARSRRPADRASRRRRHGGRDRARGRGRARDRGRARGRAANECADERRRRRLQHGRRRGRAGRKPSDARLRSTPADVGFTLIDTDGEHVANLRSPRAWSAPGQPVLGVVRLHGDGSVQHTTSTCKRAARVRHPTRASGKLRLSADRRPCRAACSVSASMPGIVGNTQVSLANTGVYQAPDVSVGVRVRLRRRHWASGTPDDHLTVRRSSACTAGEPPARRHAQLLGHRAAARSPVRARDPPARELAPDVVCMQEVKPHGGATTAHAIAERARHARALRTRVVRGRPASAAWRRGRGGARDRDARAAARARTRSRCRRITRSTMRGSCCRATSRPPAARSGSTPRTSTIGSTTACRAKRRSSRSTRDPRARSRQHRCAADPVRRLQRDAGLRRDPVPARPDDARRSAHALSRCVAAPASRARARRWDRRTASRGRARTS